MGHPTQHKERLMNKILAQMMIYCREHVTADQVEYLQGFKDSAPDLDWTNPDYQPLLNFDLGRYQVDPSLPQEKQEGPVDMSQSETMMQTIVEDLSEEMKREKEEEMRSNRGGGPQIAFLDLSSLSGFTALLYVGGILGFFGIIFYVLINKIMDKPVDFAKQRKIERQQKAGSKQKS